MFYSSNSIFFSAVALEPLVHMAGFSTAIGGPAAANLEERAPLSPEATGPPSRVIVLRNVVPPGAVDESLDEEIGVECSKYGEVTR
jgi:hypothetical protein